MNMIEKRMEQRGQGGFTLIELLVVIAILAVLGGAVIIGIGAMRGNAEEQVCKTNLETVELAAVAWSTEDGNDINDLDGLLSAAPNDEIITSGLLSDDSIDGAEWTLTDGRVTNQTAYTDLAAATAAGPPATVICEG